MLHSNLRLAGEHYPRRTEGEEVSEPQARGCGTDDRRLRTNRYGQAQRVQFVLTTEANHGVP